jgi:p-hydroxybenzoate 3-monooxygenase
MRTQVGIVGAGPAGLMLSHLLHLARIDSVIVENRSREYVEGRIRAGVIEHWAADLLDATGVGGRMRREGLVHGGIHFSFGDELHHFDFRKLVGKDITVYGQHELVKDLIAQRLADGGRILFEADHVGVHDFDTRSPSIRFRHDGKEQDLACDFVGGCDGFHGVCRSSIPGNALTAYEREYPFGWLGIIAEANPVSEELIYCYHARGFALFSMRSPAIVRYYLQCAPDEDLGRWPDDKIWQELRLRLAPAKAAALKEGLILQKGVTAMRSFVAEPMQFGRLFLAGDAAHIVPPTGAKGMNLAIADVVRLSGAIAEFYRSGRTELLDGYSTACLRRVWKAQRFSWWMTQMLHRYNSENDFDMQRQLAELAYVTSSQAAATSLAENYVGLPID